MEKMMISSVSSNLLAAGYSWSTTGKDRDGDGKISRAEFDAPLKDGQTVVVPADLRASGSLDDAFDSLDANKDGVIDATEALRTPIPPKGYVDRFPPNWQKGMSAAAAQAYEETVNADNARLAKQWGLDVSA